MKKLLVINGSYREDGVTDRILAHLTFSAHRAGVHVETVELRKFPIEFCTNCRCCTQVSGAAPGKCTIDDDMVELVQKIEKADGFVFASPTNMYSSTALFKRFLERLIVFAYWPWSATSPKYRKEAEPRKKAVIVSSCAAPAIIGRLFYDTASTLKRAATLVGADLAGVYLTGPAGEEKALALTERQKRKIEALVQKLV